MRAVIAFNAAMQTNVYIDGFNLYYGALKGTSYKWLNPQALTASLFPKSSINRIRYFTARITARPDDTDAPNRQQFYLRALRTLPMLDIIEGQFKDRVGRYPRYPYQYAPGAGPGALPLMEQIIKPEEKGTDVNLASYLLFDCFNGEYEQAVVISNDSDLALPVRMVRDEFGKTVIVVNPVRKARRGVREMEEASTRMVHRISPALLARSQFPYHLSDARGTFSKPPGW